ncbi:MAG: hypothetical protein JW936_09850 [Sedimentisphaerales bacterium]|nr:hypothetical protein [Sedimentisphaerales bacterium]
MSNTVGNNLMREGRGMLTLIRREVREVRVYLGGVVVLSLLVLFFMMLAFTENVGRVDPTIRYISSPVTAVRGDKAFLFFELFLPLVSAGIGAAQMRGDRNKQISTFLCTLATSRGRILIARVMVGALVHLLVLVPVLLMYVIFVCWKHPSIELSDCVGVLGVFAVVVVMNFAAYSVGLMMGWSKSRWFPILGTLVLAIVFVWVLVVKGFGVETVLISLVVACAALVRTWGKYSTDAL